MKRKWINSLLLLMTVFVVYGKESERITDFHSDIVIETSGRVLVSESITVYAAGEDIKRGIVRSIPLFRKDNNNKKVKMDFTVLSVLRDGKEETYMTEDYEDNREIYIGSKDVTLKPGSYRYTITYETYGHIGFFDKYDELYWNVTGNSWAFTIDKASASIKLPDDTTFINTACYTGLLTQTSEDCGFDVVNGEYMFETTKMLKPNEGFTIAITFPANMIDRSTYNTPYAKMFNKKDIDPGKRTPFIIISIIILVCFYFLTWWKTKTDQKKFTDGTDPSQPPQDWSPEMIRFINNGKYDEQTFTVALMGMASRGLIRIDQENDQYILERTGVNLSTPEERAICRMLFSDGSRTVISEGNYNKIKQASAELESRLTKWRNKNQIFSNLGYIISAAVITGLILLAYTGLFTSTETLNMAIMTAVAIALFYFSIILFRQKVGCVGIFLGISAIFAGMSCLSIGITNIQDESGENIIFILLVMLSFLIYAWLIKGTSLFNTQKKSINQLLSFLKTTNEPQQETPTHSTTYQSPYPPPYPGYNYRYTPRYYEEMYPYAIALDVENQWGERYHYILQRENYSPGWYNRRGMYSATLVPGITNSFNHSLRRTLRYQPPAPRQRYYSSGSSSSGSSSSGSSSSRSTGSSSWSSGSSKSSGRGSSSRGGHSGGGGGGGGGRGW